MKNSKNFMMIIAGVLLSSVLFFFACQNHENDTKVNPSQDFSSVHSQDYDQIKSQARLEVYIGTLGKSKDRNDNLTTHFYFDFSPVDYFINNSDKDLLNKALKSTSGDIYQIYTIGVGGSSRIVKIEPANDEKLQEFQKWKKESQEFEQNLKTSSSKNLRTVAMSTSFASYTDVVNAFNYVKTFACTNSSSSCIPFRYIKDGCYARAHKMKQLIELQYGKTTDKIFSIGSLTAKSSTYSCCVNWGYHVAPLVYVGTAQYVIDPSMFSGPVSPTTWKNAQLANSCNGVSTSSLYSNLYIKPGNTYRYNKLLGTYDTDPNYSNTNSIIYAYSGLSGCNWKVRLT